MVGMTQGTRELRTLARIWLSTFHGAILVREGSQDEGGEYRRERGARSPKGPRAGVTAVRERGQGVRHCGQSGP